MTKQLKEIEIPFGAKDSELCGWEYIIPEGMEATIVDNKIVVKKKESEDEIVIAALKSGINGLLKKEYHLKGIGGITFDRINTWLEKQGGHSKFRNNIQIGDKVTRNKDGMLVNLSRLNRVAKKDEKQGEQKPADKVEPKFKVDNWVVYEDQTLQIVGVFEDGYATNNSAQGFIPKEREHSMRLWTIQDAKDGDVLYCKSSGIEYIVMSKGVNEHGNIDSYFRYNSLDGFGVDVSSVLSSRQDDITPANKEQRDTLFAKMKEAGYVWDVEHKQLKKVEPKKEPTEFEEAVWNSIKDYDIEIYSDNQILEHSKDVAKELLKLAKKQLQEEFDKQLEQAYKNVDEVQYGRGYRKAVEDARKWVAYVVDNDEECIESFNRAMEQMLKKYGNKR